MYISVPFLTSLRAPMTTGTVVDFSFNVLLISISRSLHLLLSLLLLLSLFLLSLLSLSLLLLLFIIIIVVINCYYYFFIPCSKVLRTEGFGGTVPQKIFIVKENFLMLMQR